MPPQKVYPFKIFGYEGSMPRWALTPIALVIIGIGAVTIWRQVRDPERELISQKAVNAQLAAEVEEYGKHVMDDPAKHEAFEDSDGKIAVRIFKDHCVLIQQASLLTGTRTRLVMSLTRPKLVELPTAPTGLHLVEPLLAATQNPACQRGCLNPHPGAFQWKYGDRKPGGWVEVWRQWPDGCTHVQLFHPQSGAWDSNPDGSAKVKWTCCVH